MAVHVLICTSLFFFIFLSSVISQHICPQTSCSPTSQQIRFPFRLNTDGDNNNLRCSYPGFGLYCNSNNQTILYLRQAGIFIVRQIYYETQEIHISDPDNCLARRFLDGFTLSESPFIGEYNRSFVFLNCSAQNVSRISLTSARRVDCLSDENDIVFALPSYEVYGSPVPPGCRVVSSRIEVPVLWDHMEEGDTTLFWVEPNCLPCERIGGTCGFKDGSTVCYEPSRGLSKSGKYDIILGAVGVPGLLGMIVLGFYLCGKFKVHNRIRNRPSSATFLHSPSMPTTGLDGPSIELYPKTLLGESRRLPKSNDNICPICLSEYEPKETLRTIPECNHYFHVECIDGWLKMNSACPLCRNSPNVSSMTTPSSTLFSSSSSITPSPLFERDSI